MFNLFLKFKKCFFKRRLDFLNLKKSKEIIANEFENDQEILKEIFDFISE